MFQKMRRKNQQLTQDDCERLLQDGTSGVLAVSGKDGYPYAVPLSYVYDNRKIYFHCAKAGHKLDAIRENNKASFCVIGQDQVVPEAYTTYFRSVIAFGEIHILEREQEKLAAIEKLAIKYAPEADEVHRKKAIDQDYAALCVLEFSVEHMSGKEAIELVKTRLHKAAIFR